MRAIHDQAQHSSAREICVCVDDFGLHKGINEAILTLVGMGRVQAVSCQVGGPTWIEGAKQLCELDSHGVDVGLHLDLTECPLQPEVRMSLKEVIARAYSVSLQAALLRRYPGQLPWLRCTRSPQLKAHADLGTYVKASVIAALGSRGLAKLAQRHGSAQNARLLGVYNFSGSTSEYGQRPSRWLKAAESGNLLMCHVGQTAESLDLHGSCTSQ